MDYNYVITQTMAVCGMITGIAAVIALIFKAIKSAKAPNELQNARINGLEEEVKKLKEMLLNDYERFTKLEEGNKVTQRALLALLDHGIDGNEIESMKQAKQGLQNYLINQ